MSLDTLDYCSIVQLENIDNILDYSPYSLEIHLTRISSSGVFGYEESTNESNLTTKGFIIFEPETRFLKKIGAYQENKTPIVAFFKDEDKLKLNDIIVYKHTHYVDGQVEDRDRTFEIVDIKSGSSLKTAKKIYILAPKRG